MQIERNRNKIYIVAEMGTSHNGNISRAEKIIAAAKEAGADCIKSQIIFAEEIIHPETGMVILPSGKVRLYDKFKKLEKSFDFYQQLKYLTQKYEIDFLLSPFGFKSLEWLIALDCNIIKIASPELNHFPLIKKAAKSGKKIVLSTGVSLLSDVELAVSTAVNAGCPKNKIILLHCVTSYPAPENEYNISLITKYKETFKIKTGVSDHSMDPLIVPAVSVFAGASFIEKHITLTKNDGGLDDPIALIPSDFSKMVSIVRNTENTPPIDRFALLEELFGKKRVKEVLGDGFKKLAASEKANYGRTNRSVHALHFLSKGTVLTEANTALLRTEKILNPGIKPEYYAEVLGKTLVKDVENGQGIQASDIGMNSQNMDFSFY